MGLKTRKLNAPAQPRLGERKQNSGEDKKKTESSKPKVAKINKGVRKKSPGESITAVAGSTNHVIEDSPTSSHKHINQNMLDSDRNGGEIDMETNTQDLCKRTTDDGNEAAGVPVIDKTHKNCDKVVKTRKRKRHHNLPNKTVFDKVTA